MIDAQFTASFRNFRKECTSGKPLNPELHVLLADLLRGIGSHLHVISTVAHSVLTSIVNFIDFVAGHLSDLWPYLRAQAARG